MMTNIPAPHPKYLLISELPRIDLGSDYSSATLKSKACKAVAYEAHFWGSASTHALFDRSLANRTVALRLFSRGFADRRFGQELIHVVPERLERCAF